MKYKCISYPEFEPDHAWLRKTLLFADEVYRIVPKGEQLTDSDKLKQLIECCPKAVQKISPDNFVDAPESQAKLLGTALDQPTFQKAAISKKKLYRIDQIGRIELRGWEYLHVDKVGPSVMKVLTSRGMYKDSLNANWKSVPRGVGNLVLSMLANRIAIEKGFDAVTDQPLAFALNTLTQLSPGSAPLIDGTIASVVIATHVPKEIELLPAKKYAELRKRTEGSRFEFVKMVRELKLVARLDQPADAKVIREKLDDIVMRIGEEMEDFRNSRFGKKINDWVPMVLTTTLPVAAGALFGVLPALGTAGFTLGVNSLAQLTKPKATFAYPKVLQALYAADKAASAAGIRAIGRLTDSRGASKKQ